MICPEILGSCLNETFFYTKIWDGPALAKFVCNVIMCGERFETVVRSASS
mgnify:CR=1 FL=1